MLGAIYHLRLRATATAEDRHGAPEEPLARHLPDMASALPALWPPSGRAAEQTPTAREASWRDTS